MSGMTKIFRKKYFIHPLGVTLPPPQPVATGESGSPVCRHKLPESAKHLFETHIIGTMVQSPVQAQNSTVRRI